MIHFPVLEKKEWRWWVTPKLMREKPIHRWFTFSHSFSGELVHSLLKEWGLGRGDKVLDPFAGAGTTLLACKAAGVPASGYDLSPLAVFASKVKVAGYRVNRLEKAWDALKRDIRRRPPPKKIAHEYPDLIKQALRADRLAVFDALRARTERVPPSSRNFFKLALLGILPMFSDAVAGGGWLKWIKSKGKASQIVGTFEERVAWMLDDLRKTDFSPNRSSWRISLADARSLPDSDATYSAVITSPPYPNRHDYTRVFGVELMFGFSDAAKTRKIRYQSFHSHPEARPRRPSTDGYIEPTSLAAALCELEKRKPDHRVVKMLRGYFVDMFLCLHEMRRVCKMGGKIALIVGNAQYRGIPFLVDELTAEIGEQTGLTCEKLYAARYRGNSAQQMGKFGRNPSRESVVVFQRHGP
jgi:hypothetical protein